MNKVKGIIAILFTIIVWCTFVVLITYNDVKANEPNSFNNGELVWEHPSRKVQLWKVRDDSRDIYITVGMDGRNVGVTLTK